MCIKLLRVFLFLAIIPHQSLAMEFGEIQLHSAFNEKLKASFTIEVPQDQLAGKLMVGMADSLHYKSFGLADTDKNYQFVFEVRKKSESVYQVLVSSLQPIDDLYLNLLIRVSGEGEPRIHHYILLMDSHSELLETEFSQKKNSRKSEQNIGINEPDSPKVTSHPVEAISAGLEKQILDAHQVVKTEAEKAKGYQDKILSLEKRIESLLKRSRRQDEDLSRIYKEKIQSEGATKPLQDKTSKLSTVAGSDFMEQNHSPKSVKYRLIKKTILFNSVNSVSVELRVPETVQAGKSTQILLTAQRGSDPVSSEPNLKPLFEKLKLRAILKAESLQFSNTPTFDLPLFRTDAMEWEWNVVGEDVGSYPIELSLILFMEENNTEKMLEVKMITDELTVIK